MQIFLSLFFLVGAFVVGMVLGAVVVYAGCVRLLGTWQRAIWINGLDLTWIAVQYGSMHYQEAFVQFMHEWGAFNYPRAAITLVRWVGVAYALGFLTGGWPASVFSRPRPTPPAEPRPEDREAADEPDQPAGKS